LPIDLKASDLSIYSFDIGLVVSNAFSEVKGGAMASSLIRGKYVITKVIDDNTSEVIHDGAVFQRDGEIIEVGRYDDLKARHTSDEVIGSGNQVVMPGLINDHYHVGLTPFQLGNPDLPLETWIAQRWSTRDVDRYLDTLYGAIQMIESGITTVGAIQGAWYTPPGLTHLDLSAQALKAYQDSGMRAAFSYSIRDQNRFVYQDDQQFLATLPSDLAARMETVFRSARLSTEEYFSMFADLYERFGRNQPNHQIKHLVSPSNVQWCSDPLLEATKELARRYSTAIHIHLQESVYQKLYGLRRYNKTPLAHLNDLGFLGPDVTCGHGVWITDWDIALLGETGTVICHNSSSNLRLKSGIAPLNRLLEKDITVAMGIDEAGINDDKDMFQEMRLVQKLHRIPGVDSPSPTSHQVLRMATINGAKAVLWSDQIGTLERGKRADVILVNLEHITEPYLDPDTNIVDAVIYRGRGLDVDTVIVNGEVIMQNRQLTRVNKAEVWAELKAQLSRELRPHEVERKETSRQVLPYVHRFYQRWPMEGGRPQYSYNASS